MNRFQCVADLQRRYGVKRLCHVLGVSRSSFYYWRRTATDRVARQAADTKLAARIRAVHQDSDSTYGVPRITAELRETGGEAVNHKRVARIMRESGIKGVRLRRRHRTTVPDPAAVKTPDLIGRDFTAGRSNTKYVGDITYLPHRRREVLLPCHRHRPRLAPPCRLGDRRPHARGARDRRPGRGGPHPRQPRRIDHAHRPRSPVHEQEFRRSLQVSRGATEHERGRVQRGQRTRRVLQRDLQTRDPARTKELADRAQSPPRRLPMAPPLQHPTPTLPPRTTITHRLREHLPPRTIYAGTSRITRVQD